MYTALDVKSPDVKQKISNMTRYNIDKIEIIYECRCAHDNKHLHHFDYSFPFKVIKLCPSCHLQEHERIRKEAGKKHRAISDINITPIPIEIKTLKKLIKDDERIFLKKLAPIASEKLCEYITRERLNSSETAALLNVQKPRISELKKPDQYDKSISKPDLRKLLKTGILTINDIKAKIDLTETEQSYLGKLMNI